MKLPGQVWLKRYFDCKDWIMLREESVVWDLNRRFPDWERRMRDAKEGLVKIETPYAEYMWLPEPIDLDELPINSRLVET